MTTEDMLKECEKRAYALIDQGVRLKEIDMRLNARQVIKDVMEGDFEESDKK